MIKYFCDICGVEIPSQHSGRVVRQIGRLKVEVMHTFDDTANAGQICHDCIIQAVVQGEPSDAIKAARKQWEISIT